MASGGPAFILNTKNIKAAYSEHISGILFLKDFFWPFTQFLYCLKNFTPRLCKIIRQITSNFSQHKKYLFCPHMKYLWHEKIFWPSGVFSLKFDQEKNLGNSKNMSRHMLNMKCKKNSADACWNTSDVHVKCSIQPLIEIQKFISHEQSRLDVRR